MSKQPPLDAGGGSTTRDTSPRGGAEEHKQNSDTKLTANFASDDATTDKSKTFARGGAEENKQNSDTNITGTSTSDASHGSLKTQTTTDKKRKMDFAKQQQDGNDNNYARHPIKRSRFGPEWLSPNPLFAIGQPPPSKKTNGRSRKKKTQQSPFTLPAIPSTYYSKVTKWSDSEAASSKSSQEASKSEQEASNTGLVQPGGGASVATDQTGAGAQVLATPQPGSHADMDCD